MAIQILGYIAGAFVVLASLPQIIKIARSKKADDISLPMYVALNIGVFLWIIYGVYTNQPAIIITNVVFQFFNLMILALKIKHG